MLNKGVWTTFCTRTIISAGVHTKTFFVLSADYVFFETSSTTPYQIRRIEELNKVSDMYTRITFLKLLEFLEIYIGAHIRDIS